jgi:uncharacterized protein (DUF58 family)
MKFVNSIFLTQFFFIVFSIIIGLFCLAYVWDFFFFIAKTSLICFGVFLILDLFLVFISKNPIQFNRKTPSILNLGDSNNVELEIINLQSFPVKIMLVESFPFQLQMRNKFYQEILFANDKKTIIYSFFPKQRGEYFFGNVWVYLSSPLLLMKRKITLNAKQTVSVYPSILQMKQFELNVFHQQTRDQGIKKIRRMGHNNEFEQIKNYVQGDDLRTINWKATGKKRELMVNQYQEERSQSIYAVIDKSRNMQAESEGMSMLDFAINSALVFTNIAIKKGDRAGLITFSDKIGTQLVADKSTGQQRRILNLLYSQKTHFKDSSFELLYESIRQTVKTRSLIMLYTNFESEFALKRALPVLKKINQKHVLVVVFFQNNELEELAFQKVETVDSIYLSAVAEKLISLKFNMAKLLKQNGIQMVLTRPEDLNVNTINKYLEIKSRGII